MDIRYTSRPEGDALCWCVFEAEGEGQALQLDGIDDPVLADRLLRAARIARFVGKPGQVAEILAPDDSASERLILVGLGKRGACDPCVWRDAGAHAVRHCLTSGARNLCLIGASDAKAATSLALGARLGSYRFDRYRPGLPEDQKPTLAAVAIALADVKGAKAADVAASAIADGVSFARTLVSEPPNVLHPEEFARRVEALEDSGLSVEVLGDSELETLGMRAMLAVGEGSSHGSRLCVIKWQGKPESDGPPLVLVGKGVTFDSGGVSIKHPDGMEAMKGDMAGAAAVAGTMLSLAKRRASANVVGLIGLVENMPDGRAFRPADILTSASGKTIEILSTDAEGRLLLCDLLHFAQERFKPDAIIDLATLTGAIIVALGNEHAGLFANDDALAASIIEAGKSSGEPVWRLPLSPAYDKLIDSEFADIKNSANGGAGSITAAQFLQRFIGEGVRWAHLDIAGTAWKAKRNSPCEPSWATGYGVQLLDRLVADGWELR